MKKETNRELYLQELSQQKIYLWYIQFSYM